jgi:hypothetical protein
MYRGDTQLVDVLVTDPDTGNPVDISTMSLRFTAKYRTTDADDEAIIAKTSDYGGIVIGGQTGEAVVTIDPEDTIDLTKTTQLLWDLQVTDVSGAVRTAAAGRIIISADVSITVP